MKIIRNIQEKATRQKHAEGMNCKKNPKHNEFIWTETKKIKETLPHEHHEQYLNHKSSKRQETNWPKDHSVTTT